MNALEIGEEVSGQHRDEIIVLARHQVTGDDRRRQRDGLLESLEQFLVLALEADLHDHGHAETERLAAEPRLVALDDVSFFERTDAPGDRGGGQRDTLGEVDLALPPILQQSAEDRAIQRI